MVAYTQIVIAVFVTIVGLETCMAQIKFKRLVTAACHTCADAGSNSECNMRPTPCQNPDDACMAVVWAYPDGRQRVYKQCVPTSFCKDFRRNDCLSTRNLQRCRYCCWGPLCNEASVPRTSAKWDRE